ncbi:MAG: hypothetical protein JO029_09085 [Candidatus Eremiobacteraeota bacterium]|nr:hypothetical protein [Candidatus Eremiobacteraeota bacterium]MBV8283732.1 hypothetical protein [Candidatus Eremiobacteraeota bacterium]MBV8331494.1 hypothetical protein [Candidatus Eremiobacteraeota bacterium]MBV8434422.1 hypothetical protein [Candidatus Eremiobacteraeota bacterium]MBV8584566.1 hypothetical protein [Candidatus Eremiobacteraeota bacterium]
MLRTFLSAALMVTVASLFLTAPALADTHKFTVKNNGGHQIDRVYLSPISSRKWGPDQMGDDVISPGQSQTWDVETDCEIDVKIVYHDGTVKEKDDVDTCKYDLVMDY